MENGPFIDGLLKMVIFHGYVKYPERVHITNPDGTIMGKSQNIQNIMEQNSTRNWVC
jgi:hypothetical protein